MADQRSYGPPSAAALDAAAAPAKDPIIAAIQRDAVKRAHDPALGLDRSVCLRDVIERLQRSTFSEATSDMFRHGFAYAIERVKEMGDGR